MMKKCIVLFMMSGGILLPAFSQQPQDLSQQLEKETCKSESVLCGNWYLEGGAGVQMLFSKDASKLDFGKRITPLFSLSAGKWFSPKWGIRLQGNAYSLNGFSSYRGLYTEDANGNLIYGNNDPVRDHVSVRPDGSYRHYLRYLNLHADYRISLFNLFGWKAKERGDIIPSIGIGYFQTFGHKGMPAQASMSGNFSIAGKYRVSENWDLNMEVQTAVLPDAFEGRIAGQRYEYALGISLGVTWNLPYKKAFAKKRCSALPVPRVITDTIEVEREVIVERVVVEKQTGFTPFVLSSIRFGIGSHLPSPGQQLQFVNVVRFMNDNPDVRLRISGYADAKTGTPAYNLTLSGMRAKEVCRILTDDYQIERTRLEVQGVGMNEQPYDQNNWNRVVTLTPFF